MLDSPEMACDPKWLFVTVSCGANTDESREGVATSEMHSRYGEGGENEGT